MRWLDDGFDIALVLTFALSIYGRIGMGVAAGLIVLVRMVARLALAWTRATRELKEGRKR